MEAFRKRQNSERWHWSKDCPNYPTENDVFKSGTKPDIGVFCEECQEKEPLKEPSEENK